MADEWHGQVVEHHKGATSRTGRLDLPGHTQPELAEDPIGRMVPKRSLPPGYLPRLAKVAEGASPARHKPKAPCPSGS